MDLRLKTLYEIYWQLDNRSMNWTISSNILQINYYHKGNDTAKMHETLI